MRNIWILVPVLVQCSRQHDEQIKTEIIYKPDTVYVEKNEKEANYPWDLECNESADTQTDMNICSRDCSIIADSLTEKMYLDVLTIYDKKIEESIDAVYYRDQKARIKIIHEHFKTIRTTASDYKYEAYEGGTIAPLMVNSTKTWVSEIEFELLNNLKFEAEQI